ncbi:hypothetical protein WMC41_18505 [Shinella yambaruensis]|uniref:hypothetical protein n=1 Tax=Shinella yambaruensis TaxID=415996 RepID=UPI003D79F417
MSNVIEFPEKTDAGLAKDPGKDILKLMGTLAQELEAVRDNLRRQVITAGSKCNSADAAKW